MEDYSPADVLARGKGSSDSSNENITLFARDRFTIGDHWTFNAGLRLLRPGEPQRRRSQGGRHPDRRAASGGELRHLRRLEEADHAQRGPLLRPAQPAVHQRVADGGVERLERVRRLPLLRRARRRRARRSAPRPATTSRCGASVRASSSISPSRASSQSVDLDPYYKDEIIVGFEWQVSNNWAFDAKGIYWELGDIIMNTTQRWISNPAAGYDGQDTFQLSVNDKNFQDVLRQTRPGARQHHRQLRGALQGVLGAPVPDQPPLLQRLGGLQQPDDLQARDHRLRRVVEQHLVELRRGSRRHAHAGHDRRVQPPTAPERRRDPGSPFHPHELLGGARPVPRHAGLDHQSRRS